MRNIDLARYLIDPAKKIEVFLINSSDIALKKIVELVIYSRELDTVKRELAINLVIIIASKIGLRIKLESVKRSPLRKLSELIKDNYRSISIRDHDKSIEELNPLDLLSPVKLATIIFYNKIKRVFKRNVLDFLELMLKESRKESQVIISLLVAIYYEFLTKKQRRLVEKYFILNKDFLKTLIVVSLLYLLKESSFRVIIVTKKTYFRNKYLSGYSLKELPLGTKLIVIEKSSSYYRARKLNNEISRTYILHVDEVEVIERRSSGNTELQNEIKSIIREITGYKASS